MPLSPSSAPITPFSLSCLSNAVHVWRASLQQPVAVVDKLWSLLDQSERQRADRFVQLKHRSNFIVARAVLRQLIAAYVEYGCSPGEVVFQQNDYGKLALAEEMMVKTATAINFNLSHAGDIAVYAFSVNRCLGIDTECMRQDVAIFDIAARFFTAQENQALAALPQELQLPGFFNCWTRKEAFIKAIGHGLSYALDKFSVDLEDLITGAEKKLIAKRSIAESARVVTVKPAIVASEEATGGEAANEEAAIATPLNLILHACDDGDGVATAGRWSLFNLVIEYPYCAALVVEGELCAERITCYDCADYTDILL